ncbi:MAG: hypothetical protein ZNDK_0569 [Candidatus Desulfovibrio kirbyi]|uniref:DUF3800 domain-containing protein n=1 Tax=Candidatus Desulfovibrio kirbyi TaxID=2696086 RepID=A0A6L2R5E1_9BACT|nr:MAG: hypothetical protein ZNDK_0569 [Candidatus Desulfovibrio kirbyi]
MEYILWCDESDKRGELFSNFYGGALVSSIHANEVIARLNQKKNELNLFGEIKWTKITEAYQNKYIALIDEFFSLIAQGYVKIRIMFTDNTIVPIGLTKQQQENEYFLLYYQFIKFAFGLLKVQHSKNTKLRINFDKIPDSKEKSDNFKSHIFGMNYFLNEKNLELLHDNISEIDSHDHVILQCLDVILGSMSFRMNKKHLDKPVGSSARGKKTRAKDTVYKFINKKIQSLYTNYKFNIGISTGMNIAPYNADTATWETPYRHWLFSSSKSTRDWTQKKR